MTDEQVDSHGQANRTRRGLLRGLGTTAGTTLLAAGIANHLAGSTAAVDADASEFTAADTPTVENNDGEVSAVYVAPQIEIDWENFADGVDVVSVTLEASVGEQTDLVYDVTLEGTEDDSSDSVDEVKGGTSEFSEKEGTFEITFIQHDITGVGTDITEDDFSDSSLEAGDSKTTTVELELTVDADGNQNEDDTVTLSDSFDVEVENPDGETQVDGDANTDAE
ncbi:Uncharacterized protein AArcCO_0762 [Halalkaliarchaeum sp. AArc-CO]|uniref:hypothetical protein n=1 Tax=Halalkaliarchaeum sp. AArc-CO TaxID=2866381 RepID=UPI00217D0170|nr:hypothetical protein [Halalkaliarchaeum sp. AArc-CO]UWG50082.1 Uncharacterized protein AArcCO_0762 [Halalkaliarchaeum sp. AArc-CO]